jgi:hypothetical protein
MQQDRGAAMKPWKIGTSYAVAFSRDGRMLATLGRDVSVWDLALKSKMVRSHPFSHPSDAAFSPDQRHLAVKSTSGQIVVIDTQSGLTVVDFKNAADGEGSNLQYSFCGAYIVDGSWGGRLSVRRVDSGAHEFVQDFGGEGIRSVHRSADGQHWIIAHVLKATSDDQPPPPDYFFIWAWPFRRGGYRIMPERVRSHDRRHSPLTENYWRSSMARHPTRCRYFGPTTARALQLCPFRAEAPAKLWVGQPMVGLSDRFKTRLSPSTRGHIWKRYTSFLWPIRVMWHSRPVATPWHSAHGRWVG